MCAQRETEEKREVCVYVPELRVTVPAFKFKSVWLDAEIYLKNQTIKCKQVHVLPVYQILHVFKYYINRKIQLLRLSEKTSCPRKYESTAFKGHGK